MVIIVMIFMYLFCFLIAGLCIVNAIDCFGFLPDIEDVILGSLTVLLALISAAAPILTTFLVVL